MPAFRRYPSYKHSGVEWLGDVPEHWSVDPLRACAELSTERNRSDLPVLSVYREYGVIPKDSRDDNHNATSLDTSNYKVIRPGDLAVNKMKAWQGSLGVSEHHGIVSPAYITCRIDQNKVNGRYLHYLLRSRPLVGALDAISYGVRVGQWDMRWEDFKLLQLTYPPCAEQDRIVAFLDEKTAQIDALIAKKQRQIKLLDEQKAILINRAVTRGVHPNSHLQDSGIEWLPSMPRHWQRMKLRHLAAMIQTGPFGSQLHSVEYVEGGVPVVNPSHMKDGTIVPDRCCAVSERKATILGRHKLQPGDIVFARRGELGRCALVTEVERDWLCGTGSLLFRPKTGTFDPAYLIQVLSDYRIAALLTLQSVGSTMDNLNTAMIANISIPLPPISEQADIMKAVSGLKAVFQVLGHKVESLIQTLQTLRSTLIAHTVTGKVRVECGL